jgi:hypothetical protein
VFADLPKGLFAEPPDEWWEFLGVPPPREEGEDYPLMEGHPW